jgi:Nucleoside-diphosphate-sugar epimerases
MRILLTGGAGFIGSHLVRRLLAEGNQVAIIDDLSTGKRENIIDQEGNENFTFYEGSILNYKLMLKLVTECDCVYHLAAAVGVKYIVEHPLDSLITNVRGTEIVFELAHIFKKKFFWPHHRKYTEERTGRLRNDDRIFGIGNYSPLGLRFFQGL